MKPLLKHFGGVAPLFLALALLPAPSCTVAQAAGGAALDALQQPGVYLPAAGAVAFGNIPGFDEQVAEWASSANPLFGSQEGAQDWSDAVVAGLAVQAAVGSILTGPVSGNWSSLGADVASGALSAGSNELLKSSFERRRPDGSDLESFPAVDAATATVSAGVATRSWGRWVESPLLMTGITTVNTAAAASVAWAQLEANRHYPSDVMTGAAIASFMTSFSGALFEELFPTDAGEEAGGVSVQFRAVGDGFAVELMQVF